MENEDDDEREKNENGNKPTSVRCNYGLCDFPTVMFASKIDFHINLKSDHGFDNSEFQQVQQVNSAHALLRGLSDPELSLSGLGGISGSEGEKHLMIIET